MNADTDLLIPAELRELRAECVRLATFLAAAQGGGRDRRELRELPPDELSRLLWNAGQVAKSDLLAAAAEVVQRLAGSLKRMVGVEEMECRFDDAGFCRAHYSGPGCRVAEARRALGLG